MMEPEKGILNPLGYGGEQGKEANMPWTSTDNHPNLNLITFILLKSSIVPSCISPAQLWVGIWTNSERDTR